MQIVIDIPEEIVEWINKYPDYIKIFNGAKIGIVVDAINNGTPLPREQEPFMNKPCVAHQVCHEDKIKMLDKIRAEIESCREDEEPHLCDYRYHRNEGLDKALEIVDKYKAESEG